MFGDLYGAKLRTQNERAEKLRIENAVTRGNLLNRAALSAAFATIADAVSARIMACSELSRAAREDILKDIVTWPLALREVAHARTKVRRADGGDGDDERES
jgi:hypothetical protein